MKLQIKEFAGLTGCETVLDAYSGTGTIGMIMADSAKTVISVESNEDAVKDAVENAKINGIKNFGLGADVRVLSQSPAAGTKLKAGEVVTISVAYKFTESE